MLKIPKRISPNFIVQAIVQFKFVSTITNEESLPFFSQLLIEQYPALKITTMQGDPELNPSFTLYMFSNDEYSVTVSPEIISFEMKGEYKGWNDYVAIVNQVINKVSATGKIASVKRVGVRYGDVLDKYFDTTNVISTSTTIPFSNYPNDVIQHVTTYRVDEVILVLQIFGRGRFESFNLKKITEGIVIDIDAAIPYLTDETNLGEALLQLPRLHDLNKQLFFTVLSEEFVSNLSPVYE